MRVFTKWKPLPPHYFSVYSPAVKRIAQTAKP
jgi:hypothetical protein